MPEGQGGDLIASSPEVHPSNSVCYAYDGQAIGGGAGQQSRIHCTRLAGSKADTWFLRQNPKVLDLPFLPTLGRPERDNVIDGYINGNEEDVCAEGNWQKYFTHQPEHLTAAEARAWLDSRESVALGSDAFFPFSDNIERAHRSGVKYIAEPGGSVRDDLVIACDEFGWPWPSRHEAVHHNFFDPLILYFEGVFHKLFIIPPTWRRSSGGTAAHLRGHTNPAFPRRAGLRRGIGRSPPSGLPPSPAR